MSSRPALEPACPVWGSSPLWLGFEPFVAYVVDGQAEPRRELVRDRRLAGAADAHDEVHRAVRAACRGRHWSAPGATSPWTSRGQCLAVDGESDES